MDATRICPPFSVLNVCLIWVIPDSGAECAKRSQAANFTVMTAHDLSAVKSSSPFSQMFKMLTVRTVSTDSVPVRLSGQNKACKARCMLPARHLSLSTRNVNLDHSSFRYRRGPAPTLALVGRDCRSFDSFAVTHTLFGFGRTSSSYDGNITARHHSRLPGRYNRNRKQCFSGKRRTPDTDRLRELRACCL